MKTLEGYIVKTRDGYKVQPDPDDDYDYPLTYIITKPMYTVVIDH